MPFKIYAKNSDHLCTSCKHAIHMRGHKESDEMTFCNWGHTEPLPVKFPVKFCSKYENVNDKDLYELRKVAWIIATDKKGQIGFYRKTDYFKEVREGRILNSPDDDEY